MASPYAPHNLVRQGATRLDLAEMKDATRRKAVFREMGRTAAGGVNPGQACAAALEKAFRAGVEAARSARDFDPAAKAPERARIIEPIDLAPRSRDAMRRISIWHYGVIFGEATRGSSDERVLLLARWNAGFPPAPRWHLTDAEDKVLAHFADGTLKPLFDMGLLAPYERDDLAVLTVRGKLLCLTGRTAMDVSIAPAATHYDAGLHPPAFR